MVCLCSTTFSLDYHRSFVSACNGEYVDLVYEKSYGILAFFTKSSLIDWVGLCQLRPAIADQGVAVMVAGRVEQAKKPFLKQSLAFARQLLIDCKYEQCGVCAPVAICIY